MNLAAILEESAKKFPRRKCLISSEGSFNFSDLNKKTNQFASGLKEKLGIKKGDRVGLLMKNCPEFIIGLFAILKAGAVCIPLNIFLTPNELKYILKDSNTKLLISSADFMQILPDLSGLAKILLLNRKTDRFLCWEEILIEQQSENITANLDGRDLALLIYTSGTTGFPKGVMLSHENLYSNVISSLQALEISVADRFLLILPMFHTFSLTVCILIPICAGAGIVIVKSIRPFRKVLQSVFFNRITVIVAIPQLFDILKNLDVPPILQRLLRVRICISGAAPLSRETLKAFKEKFKRITLLEGYGLTEASPVVSINPLHGLQKPGSIGLPIPGVEVKVLKEDETEAAEGEIGELVVKGANVMRGYLNLPQETQETIRNGWLFTGDMAKIDNDGYIYIVDRKKEMIISHGINIYPSEIENILRTHPLVKEAAVIGRKDKFKGEIPVAFIVLDRKDAVTETEIIAYCKGKIANYKIPRMIYFREELPKTPTGKILKRKLSA